MSSRRRRASDGRAKHGGGGQRRDDGGDEARRARHHHGRGRRRGGGRPRPPRPPPRGRGRVAPPYAAKGPLKSAIRYPDPVIFLEHKRAYRLYRQELPDEDYTIPIGKADVKREGKDITLITYGMMLHHSLMAAEPVAAEDGISVEGIELRTISPLDKETVLSSVEKTGKALVVYEDNLTGGFGAEVAAIIAEEAFDSLDGPVTRVASPDVPIAPFAAVLEAYVLPNAEKIAKAVRELAAY